MEIIRGNFKEDVKKIDAVIIEDAMEKVHSNLASEKISFHVEENGEFLAGIANRFSAGKLSK